MGALVLHLISQIPVGHIDATVWCDEFFGILEYLNSLSPRLQMMKRCQEEEGVE